MPTYKQVAKTFNEEYQPAYWGKIRALYGAGPGIRNALKDKGLRDALLPKNPGEEDYVYQNRLSKAYIMPYFGHIIDGLVRKVGEDPIRISEDGPEDALEGKTNGVPFYDDFFQDVTPPKSAKRKTLNQFLKEQLLTALLCKRAWSLVDLPSVEPEAAPRSKFEESAAGLDEPYLCPVDPECVLDWETDEYGDLAWANVCNIVRRRASIAQGRNIVEENYTVYDRETWTRYTWTWDAEKTPDGPEDDAEPTTTKSGPHSFKRVPLLALEVDDGLWAGGKLESLMAEHLNKESALSWGMTRSLFQFMVVKLAQPDSINPITEDPKRGVNQIIGPGRVMTLGEKDTLEYAGPEVGPFEVAMKKQDQLRDEMYRVTNKMAQSVDNSGAALKRSGESKAMDMSAESVVARALGGVIREHAEDIYETVSTGRGEDRTWVGQGGEEYESVDQDALVNEAVLMETVPVPSPTYQILRKFEFVRATLKGATEEQMKKIMEELKEGISAEDELAKATHEATAARVEDGVLPGETPPPPDEGAPPKGKKPAAKKKAKK